MLTPVDKNVTLCTERGWSEVHHISTGSHKGVGPTNTYKETRTHIQYIHTCTDTYCMCLTSPFTIFQMKGNEPTIGVLCSHVSVCSLMFDDNSLMNFKTLKDTLFSDTSLKANENVAGFSSMYLQAGNNKLCILYTCLSQLRSAHFIKRLD